MIRVLLVTAMVAGCAQTSAPISVGADLLTCPDPPPPPAAPPRIRTAAQLAQFAVHLELAREKTRDALVECDRRRSELVRMIGR